MILVIFMIKDVPKNAGSIVFIWWLTLNLGYFCKENDQNSWDLDGPFVRRFSKWEYLERFFLASMNLTFLF